MSGFGASVGDIRAGRAYVEIGADDSDLARGLYRAAKKLQDFGAMIRGAGLVAAGAGGAIFAPLAAMGQQYASHGEELNRSSKITGMSVESMSTLGYAAKQTRVDSEALEKSIAKMDKTLTGAAMGEKEASDALAMLGMNLNTLSTSDQETRFKMFADAIAGIHDPALQAGEAMKVFGRGAADILPLLQLGAGGISELQDRALQLGLQWSGEDARAATQFMQTLRDMWEVLKRAGEVVGSVVAPVMDRLAVFVTNATIAVTGWVREHKELIQTAFAVAGGLVAAGAGLVVLGTGIQVAGIAVGTLGSVLGGLTIAIKTAIAPIGMLYSLMTGLVKTTATLAATALRAAISPLATMTSLLKSGGAALVGMLDPIQLLSTMLTVGVLGALAAGAVVFFKFTDAGRRALDGIIDYFHHVWDAIKFVFDNSATIGQTWALATGELGFLVLEGWESAKGGLKNYWMEFRDFIIDLWDTISDTLSNGMVSGWIRMIAKIKEVWGEFSHWAVEVNDAITDAIANATTRAVMAYNESNRKEEIGLIKDAYAKAKAQDKDQSPEKMAQWDEGERQDIEKANSRYDKAQKENQANIDYLEGYRQKQRQQDRAELDRKIGGIEEQKKADLNALDQVSAANKKALDDRKKKREEDRQHDENINDQKTADAVDSIEEQKKAWEKAQHDAFAASGQKSWAEQLAKFFSPLNPINADAGKSFDLESNSARQSRPVGSFGGISQTVAQEIFGGPAANPMQKLIDNTGSAASSLAFIEQQFMNNPLVKGNLMIGSEIYDSVLKPMKDFFGGIIQHPTNANHPANQSTSGLENKAQTTNDLLNKIYGKMGQGLTVV